MDYYITATTAEYEISVQHIPILAYHEPTLEHLLATTPASICMVLGWHYIVVLHIITTADCLYSWSESDH
ncbi:hypothetical protein EMCRGX_G033513 [Ephydatia muelleri]